MKRKWFKNRWIKKIGTRIKSFAQLLRRNFLLGAKKVFVRTKNSRFLTKSAGPLLLPYLIIMILLIVVPLLLILLYSFIQPTNNSLEFSLNFTNFVEFFNNQSFIVALFLAIGYAFLAAVIAIIIGYPVAYVMAFCKSKVLSRNIWILVTLPIWINMLLKMIGLQTLFQIVAPGLLGTPFSIVIGMVYAFIPFVILPIFNSLERFDRSLIVASRDLGASGWTTFWKITFKQSIPGILSGGVMLLVQAATSLVIVKYMGEGKINLIVQVIESYFFKGGNFGLGAAISVVLAIVVLIIIFLSNMLSKHYESRKGRRIREKAI